MTTMDYTTTLRAVKGLTVQTGSLACMGCGYENSCSIHGCAILRNAAEYMEAVLYHYDHMTALLDQMERSRIEKIKTLIRESERRMEDEGHG